MGESSGWMLGKIRVNVNSTWIADILSASGEARSNYAEESRLTRFALCRSAGQDVRDPISKNRCGAVTPVLNHA